MLTESCLAPGILRIVADYVGHVTAAFTEGPVINFEYDCFLTSRRAELRNLFALNDN
jgi:hypothetical protein